MDHGNGATPCPGAGEHLRITAVIQSGAHLSRCLFYIDFNMVRAGVVTHPGDWKHAGFHELGGRRQRYRIIDIERLLKCLNVNESTDSFREWYGHTIEEKAGSLYHARQAYWTDALAIGNREWIEAVYAEQNWKRNKILGLQPSAEPTGLGTHTVEEASETYYITGTRGA